MLGQQHLDARTQRRIAQTFDCHERQPSGAFDISEERLTLIHFIVRKAAHFTEYAVLALLAARAFLGSSREMLRRRWFLASLALVVVYALSDEYHQRFVPTRTGSVYDSLIDISGAHGALCSRSYVGEKRED